MAQSKENTNNSARSKATAAAQSTGAPAAQTGEKRPRTTRRPYYNRRPRRPQQPREAAVPIHIYPLGGLGEVGKNTIILAVTVLGILAKSCLGSQCDGDGSVHILTIFQTLNT